MEMAVRDISQSASGGSYVVRYRAEFELTDGSGVDLTVGSVYPNAPPEEYVTEAADAIRAGFEQVLVPRNQGATVTIYDLMIHVGGFRRGQALCSVLRPSDALMCRAVSR